METGDFHTYQINVGPVPYRSGLNPKKEALHSDPLWWHHGGVDGEKQAVTSDNT